MAGAKAFHKAPRVIAQAIVDRLDLADTVFDRAEIAGPGFINFFLGNRFYAAVLEDLMAQGENYGRSDYGKGKRVLVEFVSAIPPGLCTSATPEAALSATAWQRCWIGPDMMCSGSFM